METRDLWLIVLIATFILAIVIILLFIFSPQTAQVPTDVPTILAVIGLASVGIERLLEGIWSFVDVSHGWFWPLNLVANQVDNQIKSLSELLDPLINELRQPVSAADAQAEKLSPQLLDELNEEYKGIKETLTTQLQEVVRAKGAASKSDSITTIEQKLLSLSKYNPQVKDEAFKDTSIAIQNAAQALDGFVQSFTDNPGRRIVSLYGGVLLGLGVAWTLRLNLLAAVLKPGTNDPVVWGIIGAGLVIGLGSSPAHEIIQAITNWRQNLGTNPPGTNS